MLTGGVLFLSFIALLGSAFIEPEFLELKRDVRELRTKVDPLVDEMAGEETGQ